MEKTRYLIGRNKNACEDTTARLHTTHTTVAFTHSGFIFRFHFPRAKAMWSRFSNQRMETSLSLSSLLLVHIWRMVSNGGRQGGREMQLRVHSFIREENTPFWREKHLRIPDHLCGWLKLEKEPEVSRNNQEFNHRRAMHVKKRFWRENTM